MRTPRGPVIERANEPGLPRGLVRLVVLAVLGWGAYVSGYIPDAAWFERTVTETRSSIGNMFASAPPPPAARPPTSPPQVARPSILPPPISPPPPGAIVPLPPQPPPASDSFARDFRRDVLGQLDAPAPPSPSAASPPVVASAPPPERTSLFPRAPGLPAAPYRPDVMDRFVEQELNTFNASREVPVKRAAMEKVAAAAQIGHGPARGVIVRGFPVSTIIRDVVAPNDVVRFSLDFMIHKRAFSNDARRDFLALAAWFDGERKDGQFGESVFDAVRDDSRLQTPDAINDLMTLLFRAERGCAALRRHINVFDPNTTTTGHCGLDLAGATPLKARQAGPAGIEPRRFREGLDLLQKSLGSPT